MKLDKKNLITNVNILKRNTDIKGYKADIRITKKNLNWSPKIRFKTIISKMLNDELF